MADRTIRGEIKPPAEVTPENYWLRENFYGKFSRQVTLPDNALGEQAKAQFVNGMLTLTVPKVQPAKPKSVKIPISEPREAASSKPGRDSEPAVYGRDSRP
jgi:HSP20 family molecular chaperone IbpA